MRADKSKKIPKSVDVLVGNLQGSSYAQSLRNAAKKSSGGRKKGKAKRKSIKPPIGGWKGGDGKS